jgi:hypothetical protein
MGFVDGARAIDRFLHIFFKKIKCIRDQGNPYPKWFAHFLQMQKNGDFPAILLIQPPRQKPLQAVHIFHFLSHITLLET